MILGCKAVAIHRLGTLEDRWDSLRFPFAKAAALDLMSCGDAHASPKP